MVSFFNTLAILAIVIQVSDTPLPSIKETDKFEVVTKETVIIATDVRSTIRTDFFRDGILIMEEMRVVQEGEWFQTTAILFDSKGEKRQVGHYSRVGFDAWTEDIRRGMPNGMFVDFQGDGALDMIVLEAGHERANWFFVDGQNHVSPIAADLYQLAKENGNNWFINYLMENPLHQPNALEFIEDGISVKKSEQTADDGTRNQVLEFSRGEIKLMVESTRFENSVAKSRRIEFFHSEETEPRLVWEIDLLTGLTIRHSINATYTDLGGDGVSDVVSITNHTGDLKAEYFLIKSPYVVRPIPASLLEEARKNGSDWILEEGLLRMVSPSPKYFSHD